MTAIVTRGAPRAARDALPSAALAHSRDRAGVAVAAAGGRDSRRRLSRRAIVRPVSVSRFSA